MAFLGQEEQVRELQDRFKFLYAAVFLGLGLLLMRLVFLQILMGEKMRQTSEDNRIKRVKIAAPRGMIFDRNHKLLIDNRPAFDLEITPQYLRGSNRVPQVIAMLSRITKMSPDSIDDVLEKAKNQPSFMPVKIKTDLNRDEVAQIKAWQISMPGVDVKEEIKRTNIFGDVAAHLLGYIGEVNNTELPGLNRGGLRYKSGDNIGKMGLELKMENTLRGVDGEEIKEVDALGRVKLAQGKSRVLSSNIGRPAVPGKNLILTIDQDLQLAAIKTFGDKMGSVVAIDPRTGEILAMISRPAFDSTEFARGIPTALLTKLTTNENKPFIDKTIQEHYMPGSVFKVVTAIAGLQEGAIDEHSKIFCGGSIQVGKGRKHCHSRGGHGEISVVTAISRSCDVFFYRLAQKLSSVDVIAKWANALGLGRKTGVNLPREIAGLIPTEEWKKKRYGQAWNPGETLDAAIGQGYVLTTGIQLANLYATIANGGTLYRPYLVKAIESFDGQVLKDFQPESISKVELKPKTIEIVKQGLWGVVNDPHGTAYSQRLPGMDFVGKTGTAQVIRLSADKIYTKCETLRMNDRHNAFFAGFAPAKDPVIAVAVIGEHGCHGAFGAAPIARAIIKTYLEKYYPDVYGEEVLATRLKARGQSLKVPRQSHTADDEDIVVNNENPLTPDPQQTKVPPVPQTPIAPEPDTSIDLGDSTDDLTDE